MTIIAFIEEHIFDLFATVISLAAFIISIITARQQKYEFIAQEKAVSDFIGLIAALDIIEARVRLKEQTNSKVFDDFSKEEERIYNFLASDTFVYLGEIMPEAEYVVFRARLMFLIQSLDKNENISPSEFTSAVRKSLKVVMDNKAYMSLLEKNINHYSRNAKHLVSIKNAFQEGNEKRENAKEKVLYNRLMIIKEYLMNNNKDDIDVDVFLALNEYGDKNISQIDPQKINMSVSIKTVIDRYSNVLETKFDENTGSLLFNRLSKIKKRLNEEGRNDYDVDLLIAWMEKDDAQMKKLLNDYDAQIITFKEVFSKYPEI